MNLSPTRIIAWFKKLIAEKTPASFNCRYSLTESVAQLSSVVKPSVFSALFEQCAVGKVSENKVAIQRVIPFVNNGFKPFFIGSFESSGDRTVLTGNFRLPRSTTIFMTILFGVLGIISVIGGFFGILLTVISSPNDWRGLLFMLACAGMFTAGILLVHIGKWFARNDVGWLSQLIIDTIGTQPSETDSEKKDDDIFFQPDPFSEKNSF